MMGWRYVQNTKILVSAVMSPRKHHFWSFLAITIAVYQIQNFNDFNTHTSSKSTCWDGDMRKTQKFYSERIGFIENTTFGGFWL